MSFDMAHDFKPAGVSVVRSGLDWVGPSAPNYVCAPSPTSTATLRQRQTPQFIGRVVLALHGDADCLEQRSGGVFYNGRTGQPVWRAGHRWRATAVAARLLRRTTGVQPGGGRLSCALTAARAGAVVATTLRPSLFCCTRSVSASVLLSRRCCHFFFAVPGSGAVGLCHDYPEQSQDALIQRLRADGGWRFRRPHCRLISARNISGISLASFEHKLRRMLTGARE